MRNPFRWTSSTLRHLRSMSSRVIVLPGCLFLSACATTRPGPTSSEEIQALATHVKPGDFVECEMRKGSMREFTVIEVKSGWLIGNDTSAYAGDIVKVKITPASIKRRNDALAAGLVLSAVSSLAGLGH